MADTSRSLLFTDCLNILLVSQQNNVLEAFQKTIQDIIISEEFTFNCKIHLCPTLQQCAQLGGQITEMDFIVYLIHYEAQNSIREANVDLKHIIGRMGRQKICILSLRNYPTQDAISPEEVWSIAKLNQFNIIVGSSKTPDKLKHTCKKILNLMELCTGIANGIPLVGKV